MPDEWRPRARHTRAEVLGRPEVTRRPDCWTPRAPRLRAAELFGHQRGGATHPHSDRAGPKPEGSSPGTLTSIDALVRPKMVVVREVVPETLPCFAQFLRLRAL